MMADAELYRLASWSTVWSAIALVVSAVALALFFAGPGEPFGSINDAFISLALVALMPAVLAVDRLAGDQFAPIVRVVTIAAIAGMTLAATGQILLILRVITLQDSFITGGLGVLPLLAWFVLVAVLALGTDVLPTTTGWLAVATLAGIVAMTIVGTVTTGPLLWATSVALVIVLVAWLGSLALAFTTLTPAGSPS